jgi:hypothetical protein
MSTERETLQFSLLPYRCSICPQLVTGRCQSCNQVPATHIAISGGRYQLLPPRPFVSAVVNHVAKGHVHTCPQCHVIYRVWQELDYRIHIAASPRVDISSTCKVGQKLGVSLLLLTCSSSAWPSRVLYRRSQKSRRDLWITLYSCTYELSCILNSRPFLHSENFKMYKLNIIPYKGNTEKYTATFLLFIPCSCIPYIN